MAKKDNKYTIDAEQIAVGRVATEAAMILMNKVNPDYVPHLDNDNIVTVINADKVILTGKKLDQKVYHHYSGYPGGLKTKRAKDMMENDPEQVIYRAVRGMLPANKLRIGRLKRLKFKK